MNDYNSLKTVDKYQLGHALQVIRKQCGFTQAQVADAIGVARTTLIAIEAGDRRPRQGEFEQLAEVYQRPPAVLFQEIMGITLDRYTAPRVPAYPFYPQDYDAVDFANLERELICEYV